MARKQDPYEKETFKLLLEFNDAAKDWGWTQDQGTGSHVEKSEKAYEAARNALEKRIKQLLITRQRRLTQNQIIKGWEKMYG